MLDDLHVVRPLCGLHHRFNRVCLWLLGQRDMAFGLATSQDGITWERVGIEPVFSSDDTNLRGIWYSELEYRDGTYYGYFEIQRNYQNQTDIYVGTLTTDLP